VKLPGSWGATNASSEREVKANAVLLVGAEIDNKEHVRIGNEFVNIATYARGKRINFIDPRSLTKSARSNTVLEAFEQGRAVTRIATKPP
jgi:hypothetical protein